MYAIECHGKIIGKKACRVFAIREYSTDSTRCHYYHIGPTRIKVTFSFILPFKIELAMVDSEHGAWFTS
jgi:hypothetical protein